jgi:DNA-binding response OmpR family regulator
MKSNGLKQRLSKSQETSIAMKILLVEDHQDIAGVIFDYFEIKGHILDHAMDGSLAIKLATEQNYDLIILDIMLPKISGLEVCQQLREQGVDTPILMLTARDDRLDVLSGFEHGADDYLIKPFDLDILDARVQALYRRKTGQIATKNLSYDALSLDLSSRVLVRDNCRFQLNQSQFTIMKLLIQRAPDMASREELIQEIWGDDEPEGDLLRSHIYQLRTLVDKPFEHHYIHTIPKAGYQLVLPES